MSFLIPVQDLDAHRGAYLVSDIRDPNTKALYARAGLQLDGSLMKVLKRQYELHEFYPPVMVTLDPTECTAEEVIQYAFMEDHREMAITLVKDMTQVQRMVSVRSKNKKRMTLQLDVYKKCIKNLFEQLGNSPNASPLLKQLQVLQPDMFSFSASVCSLGITLGLACRDLIEQWMAGHTASRSLITDKSGNLLGRKTDFNEDRSLGHMGQALLFADIGFLDDRFSGPQGEKLVEKARSGKPLSPEEQELWESHVAVGRDLLHELNLDAPVVHAVYNSHKNVDGSGFPQSSEEEVSVQDDQTEGEVQQEAEVPSQNENPANAEDEAPQIHIFSRIVKVATTLAEYLVYQKMTPVEAMYHLKQQDPKAYDSVLIKRLQKVFPPFPVGEEIEVALRRGKKVLTKKAVVADFNPQHPCRPVVYLKRDTGDRVTLNLAEQNPKDIFVKSHKGKMVFSFLY